MSVRRAKDRDTAAVAELLLQVCALHAEKRPDIFIEGTRKYTDEELHEIFADDSRPVFVYEDENGKVLGYAFCIIRETEKSNNMFSHKILHVDDLCVDKNARRRGIGRALYEYCLFCARENGCYSVTLNVWELNKGAKAFYESVGMSDLKHEMEKIL